MALLDNNRLFPVEPTLRALPGALFERFNIAAMSTTESPIDDLRRHQMICDSGWMGKVATSYCPDAVIDPDFDGFAQNVEIMGEMADEDATTRTNYVQALKPLLDAVGQEPDLTIILFTLDESSYARDLAPLAGVYPALKLGPPWWFHDSAESMKRFREMTTENAGFYNSVGFNDDTRAFCSIPARHDMARRVDCSFLATLVATGRLDAADAPEVAHDLAYSLAKQATKL